MTEQTQSADAPTTEERTQGEDAPITAQQEPRDPYIGELEAVVRKYHPDEDLSVVENAYIFSKKAHEGQLRKSGEPYIVHPQSVAMILAGLMLDPATIAAGLLHDSVEDVEGVTPEVIEQKFGSEIALLVDGVTKLSRLDFTSREEQQAESLRKMFLAMAKDIRVVLIKLADRLHNMRTLKFQREERQKAIARETLDIYAPLAHRLGIFSIKWELEDLSFRYLEPEAFYDLVAKIGMKRAEREQAVAKVIQILQFNLDKANIRAEITGRPKNLYSTYRKMKTQNKTFDQILDLIAIRVLVDTVQDCYSALWVVHTLWTQVPNRFKDYISMPKPNMYQSLHTTVVGTTGELRGQTFEVQIRTHEMHRTAEFGIAAHWRYKEGKQADSLDSKLYWLRQILDWQNDTRDPGEFIDALKVDLFYDEVFVFTPKGEIVNLPRGATPLDFAYRIHTAIGNKCVGAKINGRIVPLDTALSTGDFVEIMTSSSSKGPSRDWLKMVKTSEAKSKIRSFFKHEFKDENMARGRDMLEKEAKRLGYQLGQLTKPELFEPVARRYTLSSLDDLFVTVGFGGLSTSQILNRLIEEYRKVNKTQEAQLPAQEVKITTPTEADQYREQTQRQNAHSQSHGVIVEGFSDMLVRFARCCNPLPGDDIVGYISHGRGVTVHRSDCSNMQDDKVEPERMVKVSWEGATGAAYEADIQIIANDRMGLLADISTMLSKHEVPIVAISARAGKTKTITINLTLSIQNTQQLEKIIQQLLKRGDVMEVFRVST